jgi:alkylated DNA repair dioxygenase AlkB
VTHWQGSLFADGEPIINAVACTERVALDDSSWIDVTRGYLGGADEVCHHLVGTVPWRQGRSRLWEREVDDPRLSCWYRSGAALPHPVLSAVADDLNNRYAKVFEGPGLNFYRDGRDSVAFHRDRELRQQPQAMVAVLTMGARRPFRVRPRGGGRSIDLSPGTGDLLVMGGRCQLDWEHGVPKVRSAGSRVSASWRWS